jgi:2-phosphosulfolactate phosphatase
MDFNENMVEVCLTPNLIDQVDLSGKTAVIVDILRATSCITAGIASGIDHIIPFRDLEECRAMRDKGYLIAGERNGAKVEDFDIGNSPFSYMEQAESGKPVAVTTTNGTLAISVSSDAENILIGSFLNISAVKEKIVELEKDVVIVCAGWKGRVNLEDTLFAGALIEAIRETHKPKEDASLVALGVYKQSKDELYRTLQFSSHVNRLKRLNIDRDIHFCLEKDRFDVVPMVRDGKITAM